MFRNMMYLLVILLGFSLTACSGGSGDSVDNAAGGLVGDTPAQQTALEPPKDIGDACNADCGAGGTIAIQCAVGETPVCDCSAAPRTRCDGS